MDVNYIAEVFRLNAERNKQAVMLKNLEAAYALILQTCSSYGDSIPELIDALNACALAIEKVKI